MTDFDDLTVLQRILAYIRQQKVDQFNALVDFDKSELARVVPGADIPDHVMKELEGRN